MNRKMRITSEEPASPRLAPQAPGWAWRRQVATALLVGWGCLPLLPGHALAELPLRGRQLFEVTSLKVTSQASDLPLTLPSRLAVLAGPAAQETPLKSARLASLPRHSSTPLLLPPPPACHP